MNTGQSTNPSSQPIQSPAESSTTAEPQNKPEPQNRPESQTTAESQHAGEPQIAAETGQTADAEHPVGQAGDANTAGAGEKAADAAPQSDSAPRAASGPLASVGRGAGPLASRGGAAKPQSPAARPAAATGPSGNKGAPKSGGAAAQPGKPRPFRPSSKPSGPVAAKGDQPQAAGTPVGQSDPGQPSRPGKLAVPSLRQPLPNDIQDELERELAAAGQLDEFLSGSAGMAPRRDPLEDGQRVHATVLKIHEDSVFVSLGGPDEGVVPFEQFSEAEPEVGSSIEVIVRGVSAADGLYLLTLPGEAIDVSDWSDIETGSVVEATVTGANSGGLECKVGGIPAFIPISQISEHRVEDTSDFVDQKFLCVVTESNPRRGNLVLSRRAVLEREREEKRQEQLEQIQPGDLLEGIVRSVKDFGAFVDLGGLEGLIHVSKLSWDRIKHPSEVIEPGQKVKVKVEKIDKQTGKIGLSYRDLLENPWDTVAESFAPGAVVSGTVTRTAPFGAFVKLAAGVEGLVHISEVAGHRVSNVAAFVKEGEQVDVKVLSIDRDAQKISLSIKQAHHKPTEESSTLVEEEVEAIEPINKPTHQGPLRGGNDQSSGGERFGLKW